MHRFFTAALLNLVNNQVPTRFYSSSGVLRQAQDKLHAVEKYNNLRNFPVVSLSNSGET